MSGRKSNLQSYQSLTNGSMAGNLTTAVTNIAFQDNIGIQLNFTGTPTGSFAVQVSADYKQDANGNVTNVGNWVTLVLPTAAAAAGAANTIYIDLNQLSAPWIRVVYTASSGAGTLNTFVTAKQV